VIGGAGSLRQAASSCPQIRHDLALAQQQIEFVPHRADILAVRVPFLSAQILRVCAVGPLWICAADRTGIQPRSMQGIVLAGFLAMAFGVL
jgi:hypothetical protein